MDSPGHIENFGVIWIFLRENADGGLQLRRFSALLAGIGEQQAGLELPFRAERIAEALLEERQRFAPTTLPGLAHAEEGIDSF